MQFDLCYTMLFNAMQKLGFELHLLDRHLVARVDQWLFLGAAVVVTIAEGAGGHCRNLWCGGVWCDVVLCGGVWCSVVSCGVV